MNQARPDFATSLRDLMRKKRVYRDARQGIPGRRVLLHYPNAIDDHFGAHCFESTFDRLKFFSEDATNHARLVEDSEMSVATGRATDRRISVKARRKCLPEFMAQHSRAAQN